jgi:hypothetical protein
MSRFTSLEAVEKVIVSTEAVEGKCEELPRFGAVDLRVERRNSGAISNVDLRRMGRMMTSPANSVEDGVRFWLIWQMDNWN